MEFVEGEMLENLIKRSGRLEVKLALEIATQVAGGLAAVHEQNLVHRDIKPTNIMVSLKEDQSVTAKIIDLSLTKTVDESVLRKRGFHRPGAFVGTPEFASPEQFCGSCRGHSLGSLLVECSALGDVLKGELYELSAGWRHQYAHNRILTLRRKQNSEARRSKAKVRSRQPKFAQQWGPRIQ